jgi:uncharacterized protein (TIGR00296 family)
LFTLEQGTKAVRAARAIIDAHVRREPTPKLNLPKEFSSKGGVFVTINTFPKKDLRGCIGYPEPVLPLNEALVDAAKSASTRDPRFPSVSPDELEKIIVEVSLLTRPSLIKVKDPSEYPKKIVIGQDGLIAEYGMARGLLLPQVPIEWKWEAEEFLEHTCMKAGLPANAWQDERIKIYKFQGQVFDETEPRGDVVERKLAKE